jgi:muramidase (phage lysozyme)
VIEPESSGNFGDTSGGYGILVSTWQSYGMSGVPGDYSADTQAQVALQIYAANGGFGPGAWNNGAGCGKGG